MDVVNPDLKALYLERRLLPHEAVQTVVGCKNLILGMSAAQPPALMAATADALKDRLIGPLAIYYLHGTESLRQSLLVPELSDQVIPRPLFLSHSDRAAIAQSGSQSWIEFVPAMLPLIQSGVMNGRRKTWMQHKHVFTLALSRRNCD